MQSDPKRPPKPPPAEVHNPPNSGRNTSQLVQSLHVGLGFRDEAPPRWGPTSATLTGHLPSAAPTVSHPYGLLPTPVDAQVFLWQGREISGIHTEDHLDALVW